MSWELSFPSRGEAQTQVELVCDGFGELFHWLQQREGRFYLVVDESVLLFHPHRLAPLKEEAWGVSIVPGGDRSKKPSKLAELCSGMAEVGLGRRDAVVVVGGGSILDLGGLAAALYLRGVSLIQVPTTLLSAVDACLGGKCAVDLPEGRNLMGVFHFAEKLLVDPLFLGTLPLSEFFNGLGEVAKYGLGFSEGLMDWLLALPPLGPSSDPVLLEDLVGKCLRIKSEVVMQDPWERDGVRRTLNLGHSLAHALEAFSGPGGIGHGRAVGLGLRAELRTGGLPARERRKAEVFLDHLGQASSLIEVFSRPPGVKELQPFFLRDKKTEGAFLFEPRIETLGSCSMKRVDPALHLKDLLKSL